MKVPLHPWQKEWLLVPIAWALQLTFFFNGTFHKGPHAPQLGDGYILHSMASNYLQRGVMSYGDASPTLTQLPLYPWMLSTIYRFFGEDPRLMIWLQMFLAGISIPLLLYLMKPFLGKWRWAFATLLAFDLHQITYAGVISTEFWVAQLWLFAWLCLWSAMKDHRLNKWAFASVLLALAANIKPLSVYLPIFLIPFLLTLSRSAWPQRIKGTLLFLSLYGLLLLPLLIRNHQHTGEFPRYTTISSFNMWYFNLPYFKALEKGISIQEARHSFVDQMRLALNEKGKNIPPINLNVASDRRAHRLALGLKEHEYSQLADELSKEYLKEHFWSYVAWHLRHGPRIFLVSNLSWIKLVYQHFDPFSLGWKPSQWLNLLTKGGKETFFVLCRFWELTYSLGFLGLGLLGILRARQLQNPHLFFFTWSFPLYVMLISGVNVWGRFRYLFIPMLITLGLMGLMTLFKKQILPSTTTKTP